MILSSVIKTLASSNCPRDTFDLSGLAELKELDLAGVNGSEIPLLASARVRVALPCVFSMPK